MIIVCISCGFLYDFYDGIYITSFCLEFRYCKSTFKKVINIDILLKSYTSTKLLCTIQNCNKYVRVSNLAEPMKILAVI